jgi:hypothetical protein
MNVLPIFYTEIQALQQACLKDGLHYGDYHSKLGHFEAQKIFFMLKKP